MKTATIMTSALLLLGSALLAAPSAAADSQIAVEGADSMEAALAGGCTGDTSVFAYCESDDPTCFFTLYWFGRGHELCQAPDEAGTPVVSGDVPAFNQELGWCIGDKNVYAICDASGDGCIYHEYQFGERTYTVC